MFLMCDVGRTLVGIEGFITTLPCAHLATNFILDEDGDWSGLCAGHFRVMLTVGALR